MLFHFIDRKKVKALTRLILSIFVITAIFNNMQATALGSSVNDMVSAETFRIEKTEGTVAVKNSADKDIAITAGMQLYSGDVLTSGQKSHAYISMDETKLAKTDEYTQVSVEKSGKKLQLKVVEGEFCFTVNEKLGSDENMEVATPTLSMSIRGTIGGAEHRTLKDHVIDRIWILEGKANVYVAPTGEIFPVWPGEYIEYNNVTGTMTRGLLSVDDIPGYVAEFICEDPGLISRIFDGSGLDMEHIVGNADNSLRRDQKENEENYKGTPFGEMIDRMTEELGGKEEKSEEPENSADNHANTSNSDGDPESSSSEESSIKSEPGSEEESSSKESSTHPESSGSGESSTEEESSSNGESSTEEESSSSEESSTEEESSSSEESSTEEESSSSEESSTEEESSSSEESSTEEPSEPIPTGYTGYSIKSFDASNVVLSGEGPDITLARSAEQTLSSICDTGYSDYFAVDLALDETRAAVSDAENKAKYVPVKIYINDAHQYTPLELHTPFTIASKDHVELMEIRVVEGGSLNVQGKLSAVIIIVNAESDLLFGAGSEVTIGGINLNPEKELEKINVTIDGSLTVEGFTAINAGDFDLAVNAGANLTVNGVLSLVPGDAGEVDFSTDAEVSVDHIIISGLVKMNVFRKLTMLNDGMLEITKDALLYLDTANDSMNTVNINNLGDLCVTANTTVNSVRNSDSGVISFLNDKAVLTCLSGTNVTDGMVNMGCYKGTSQSYAEITSPMQITDKVTVTYLALDGDLYLLLNYNGAVEPQPTDPDYPGADVQTVNAANISGYSSYVDDNGKTHYELGNGTFSISGLTDCVFDVSGTTCMEDTNLTNATINCGAGTKLYVKNVTVDNSANVSDKGNGIGVAVKFTGSGNELHCIKENEFRGGADNYTKYVDDYGAAYSTACAGINIESGGELDIYGTDTSKLTVYGSSIENSAVIKIEGGSANNYNVASYAIGSNFHEDGASITVHSGNIYAYSKPGDDSVEVLCGAGCIGGGKNTKIVVEGGFIDAYGGTMTCIGGGFPRKSSYAEITINGGEVNAAGYSSSAAIGYNGTGVITINGGRVNAYVVTASTRQTVGIGGSYGASAGTINISGGVVTATVTGGDVAAIGTCENGTGGTINITGGTVTAKSSYVAVGAGKNSEPVDVYIDGIKTDASGEYDGSSNVFTYGSD